MNQSKLFLLIFSISFLFSCTKDENKKEKIVEQRSTFSTNNSGEELTYIFERIKSMDEDLLSDFLDKYGQPSWNNSFQKRGSEATFTSVPMISNDSIITGIFKLYITDEDTVRLNFFTTSEIDSALQSNLGTSEFHAYRGAVQSLIICAHLANISIDQKYYSWLEDNMYRIEERLRYFCIEEWDCSGIYTSNTTGWTYNNSVDFSPIWGNNSEVNGCRLISRECWIDWTPRNFPSSWSGGGNNENNSNNNSVGGNGEGPNIIAIKSEFLTNWLNNNNLSLDFFDELYDCVIYLDAPFGEDELSLKTSCLKDNLVNVFKEKYPALDLNPNETLWLKNNYNYIAKLIDFLDNRTDLSLEARDLAVETYLELLANNPSFEELDELWPTLPSFVWPFIKDIGAEIGAELFKKLAKKYTPTGQVENVIDAIKALGQGELLGFIGEVFDIIKTKFPAAAFVDAGIDSYYLYQKAEPVWKAISKMEQFGGEVIEKFLSVIKNTGGNVLDKFKWVSNNVGAEIKDIGNAETFWDNIENNFSTIPGFTLLLPTELAPYEISGFKFNNGVLST